MAAAATRAPESQQASRSREGEWFWRFLAVSMLAVIGWVVWIAIQISPPEVILPAAYEAAAKARATFNSSHPAQSASGSITAAPAQSESVPAQVPAGSVAEVAPHVPPNSPPIDPPVNLEKLKVAESIETPIVERPRRAGKSTQ